MYSWQVEVESLTVYVAVVGFLQYDKMAVTQLVPVEPHTHDFPEHIFALIPQ